MSRGGEVEALATSSTNSLSGSHSCALTFMKWVWAVREGAHAWEFVRACGCPPRPSPRPCAPPPGAGSVGVVARENGCGVVRVGTDAWVIVGVGAFVRARALVHA